MNVNKLYESQLSELLQLRVYFRDVYLKKKLELDRAEANITKFVRMTFYSVTSLLMCYCECLYVNLYSDGGHCSYMLEQSRNELCETNYFCAKFFSVQRKILVITTYRNFDPKTVNNTLSILSFEKVGDTDTDAIKVKVKGKGIAHLT